MNRPAENSLPLVYSESTLGKGGASDAGMCQTSYCIFGGENREVATDSSQPQVYSKRFLKSLLVCNETMLKKRGHGFPLLPRRKAGDWKAHENRIPIHYIKRQVFWGGRRKGDAVPP